MVLAILFSVSATTISAAATGAKTTTTTETTDEKIYVSLGDSMTNGYGLPGYEEWNDSTQDFDNYFGFLVNTPDAYPNQVAENYGWTLIQLATSGLRADDIYYLLNYGTENAVEWDDYGKLYMVDKFDNTFSGTDEEVIAQAAAAYQEAIKKADVISVNVGSNNFATLMHLRMSYLLALVTGNTAMFGGYNGEFDFNELVGDLKPEDKAEIAKLYEDVKAKLFAYAAEAGVPTEFVLNEENDVTLGYVLEDLAKSAAYTTAGFALGFSGIMETINRENYEAEVIVVELTNWFAGRAFDIPVGDDVLTINVGDMFDELYEYANDYMAAVAAQYSVGFALDETPEKIHNHIEVVTNQINALINAYNAQIATLKAELNDATGSLKQEIKDQIKALENKVDALEKDLANKVDALENKIAELENDHATGVANAPAQKIYFAEVEKEVELIVDQIVANSKVDLEALYEIEDEDERFAAAFEIAEGINHSAIPDGSVRARLLKFLGDYVLSGFSISTPTMAQIENIDAAIEYYYSEGFSVDLGFGPMDRAAFEGVFASFEDCGGTGVHNTPYCQTCIGCPLNMFLGMQPNVTNLVGCMAYLGLEKSIIASLSLDAVNVQDLLVASSFETLMNTSAQALEGHMTSMDDVAAAMIANKELMAVSNMLFCFMVGDGAILHPSVNGHETIANAIIEAYDEKNTALDETVDNVIKYANELLNFFLENYEEIYAEAYAELESQGVIAELDAALAVAAEAVIAAREAVAGYEFIESLTETKALLIKELELTEATIAAVRYILTLDTHTEEQLNALNTLLANLNAHLDNLGALTAEVAGVANDQLQVALGWAIEAVTEATYELSQLTKAFLNEVYNTAVEMAPVVYEQLVNALVDAIAKYSHMAAQYAYYWLLNNPETVIGFFDTYGDDMVKFIVDNHEAIFAVLGFVGMTYGEDILYLILDNADVIIPAIADWFAIHGDLTWDLVVVYFNAIVEYYNLGLDLDFSSPEGIHASLNKIFGLLGELLAMVAQGAYDLLDALNLIDEIEAALAALDGQIRYQIGVALDALDAHVAEKIALITAQINKQLAILNEQLMGATGELKAELEKQIAALEKELEELVNAEIKNAEELAAVLGALLQDGTVSLGAFLYDVIVAYVNDAVLGEFTPNEDTVYVSVNSGDAYYAELLAKALAKVALGAEATPEEIDKYVEDNFSSTEWDTLNYDLLASADLITIGYSESEITAFAVAQLLGYINDYVDGDLRDSALDFSNGAIDALVANLLETYTALEWVLGDPEKDFVKDYVSGMINGFADAALGNGEFPVDLGLDADTTKALNILTGELRGKDAQKLDWSKFVGAENLHYVDELRAAIRAELLEQGVVESYELELELVTEELHSYLLNEFKAYVADLTLPATTVQRLNETIAELSDFANFAKLFGDYTTYTVEIPVVDTLVFAVESYVYSTVEFNYNYGKLIVDLYEINPEATIVLLGHYNAFDFELGFAGQSIDLGDLYSYVAKINSVHPFAYALLSEKVAYVSIADAETVHEQFVTETGDNSLTSFILAYLDDSSITDLSDAGHKYVYEQIMKVLTLYCDHVYTDCDDVDCNKCGEIRVAPGHVYVDGYCVNCGKVEPTTPDKPVEPEVPHKHYHSYDNCADTTCNTCGEVRVALEHAYDDCADASCYNCGELRVAPGHVFDDCEDTTCDNCGKTRVAPGHVYNNACDADCNRCGLEREAAEHVYSGCTDVNCNVCGLERTASQHVTDNKCTDNICNICGQNVAVLGHMFSGWKVTVEPTRKAEGKQTRTCSSCGLVETQTVAKLEGVSAGAVVGVTSGSVVVSGAAGFGIYWFLLQKKTFAQLLAALGKGGAVVAAEGAAAAEAAVEATAEVAAEAAEAAAETISE